MSKTFWQTSENTDDDVIMTEECQKPKQIKACKKINFQLQQITLNGSIARELPILFMHIFQREMFMSYVKI